MDKKNLNLLIGKMEKSDLLEVIDKMTMVSDAEDILLNYCKNNQTLNNKGIIYEKQLINHWHNAYGIIDDANNYGGCSYEDEELACDEIYEMESILQKHDISWKIRKEILDEMLEQIIHDNSSFNDLLLDIIYDNICQNDNEYLYLADLLSKHNGKYYKKMAASIYIQRGNDKKFLEIQKENLEYASDYIRLAKYYQENKEIDKALKIAWDGLSKCDSRLDEIYKFLFDYYTKKDDEAMLWELYNKGKNKRFSLDYITELMYDYFKNQNDISNQKKMLLNLINISSRNDIGKWYKKCKNELNAREWEKEKEQILAKVKNKNIELYLDICLENENTKEVLEYLLKTRNRRSFNNIDSGHRYSKKLSKFYPNEILELYWKEVRAFVNMGKRKNYSHAVNVLKEIKTIMSNNDQNDDWKMMFHELKEEHSRKRLFMEALNGLK
jgi:uncharacterized Zn finger protein